MVATSTRPLRYNPSWQKDAHACQEQPKDRSGVEKEMRTHPKVNKDPEETSYVSDSNLLSDALLLIKEDTHTLSL